MCYLHTPSPRLELLATPSFYKTKKPLRYTSLPSVPFWSRTSMYAPCNGTHAPCLSCVLLCFRPSPRLELLATPPFYKTKKQIEVIVKDGEYVLASLFARLPHAIRNDTAKRRGNLYCLTTQLEKSCPCKNGIETR